MDDRFQRTRNYDGYENGYGNGERDFTPERGGYVDDRGYSKSRFRSEQAARGRNGRGLFGSRNEQPQQSQIGGSQDSNVVIYTPKTFDDVQMLIDYLKRREQVIVDFKDVDQTAVYRIMDFMSGAIYALNGSIQQIANNIFLFAPAGVTITVPPQFNSGRR